jgi:hypothetical protein
VAADDGDFIPMSAAALSETLSKEELKEATGDLDPLKGGSIKGKAAAVATALAHTARSSRVAGSLIGVELLLVFL